MNYLLPRRGLPVAGIVVAFSESSRGDALLLIGLRDIQLWLPPKKLPTSSLEKHVVERDDRCHARSIQPPPSVAAICFASCTKKGCPFAMLPAVRTLAACRGRLHYLSTYVSSPMPHHHCSFLPSHQTSYTSSMADPSPRKPSIRPH